jgi:hypothetical protein
VKIWDYVDLDKTEDEIKENTEPDIPSIAAASAAPVIAPAAPKALAAAPAAPADLVATLASTRIAIPRLSS